MASCNPTCYFPAMPSTWDEILYAEIQQITDQSLPTFRNEAQRILGEHVKIGNIHSPGVFQKIIDHFREMLAAIRNRMLSVVEETKYVPMFLVQN
jgi:hypothetical protein